MTFDNLLTRQEWMNLGSIGDAGDNRLRAVIHVGEEAYELLWDRYFTFMVRDEGAAAFRKEEEYSGLGVRLFRKSWLLGVIPELSNGLHEISDVRGPVKHYGLYCLNHIVDVLAYEAPSVSEVKEPNQPSATPTSVTSAAEQPPRRP
jgi:hypothetical protein